MAATLTVKVSIDGVRGVLAAFKELPKDANNELREASGRLAKAIATKAVVDAHAHGGPQGPLLATTIKVMRDRVPVIQVGGTKRLGRNRAPAYALLFGSMFGMNTSSGWYNARRFRGSSGRQYRAHRGTNAYWFFPLVEAEGPLISREWNAAADDIVRKFSRGDV